MAFGIHRKLHLIQELKVAQSRSWLLQFKAYVGRNVRLLVLLETKE